MSTHPAFEEMAAEARREQEVEAMVKDKYETAMVALYVSLDSLINTSKLTLDEALDGLSEINHDLVDTFQDWRNGADFR